MNIESPTFIGGPAPTNSAQQNIVGGTLQTGGAVKPSEVLGGISGISAAASAIPGAAIITAPLAAITGLAGTIAKLFGGNLTQKEMEMLGHIKMRVDKRSALLKNGSSPLEQTINKSSI